MRAKGLDHLWQDLTVEIIAVRKSLVYHAETRGPEYRLQFTGKGALPGAGLQEMVRRKQIPGGKSCG